MKFEGFKSIGFLFVRSVEIYYIGVTLFLICSFSSTFRMGVFTISFFIGAILLGFILFFGPQITVHRFIHKEKEQLMQKIKEELLLLAPKNNDDFIKYYFLKTNYDLIGKINEYSFDISVLRELVFVAIIPVLTEIIIREIPNFLGF